MLPKIVVTLICRGFVRSFGVIPLKLHQSCMPSLKNSFFAMQLRQNQQKCV
jgi:hypothetical protein